jgi:hypothetical protein
MQVLNAQAIRLSRRVQRITEEDHTIAVQTVGGYVRGDSAPEGLAADKQAFAAQPRTQLRDYLGKRALENSLLVGRFATRLHVAKVEAGDANPSVC